MDTSTIYNIVQLCRGDPERLHAELLGALPPPSVEKLAVGWPTCQVCVQLLDVARKDLGGAPAQQHEVCCAMDALLNCATLRLAAAAAKTPAQTPAFRAVLGAVFGPVLKVAGDGNCFYRAVVKALFAPAAVPAQTETQLAAFLREQINPPSEDAGAALGVAPGTIVPGVNDAATMARDGTWADAMQVLKAVEFLQRPVAVLTCTDTHLRFDTEGGHVRPSAQYVFIPRSASAAAIDCSSGPAGVPPPRMVGEPLVLHFAPYGHYEAVVPAAVWARHDQCCDTEHVLAETERLALVRPPATAFAENACWAYFALVLALESALQLRRDCAKDDYELRQVVYSDVADLLRGILVGVRRLKNALCLVSMPDLRAAVPPALRLHMTLLADMSLDDIIFENDSPEPLQRGKGRLSELYKRVEDALKEKPGTAVDKAKDVVRTALHPAPAPAAAPAKQPPPVFHTEAPTYPSQKLPPLVPVSTLPPVSPQPPALPVYQSLHSGQQPQNVLISNPRTQPDQWRDLIVGNMIQFTQARVNGDALYSLLLFLQSSRVLFVEFHYCTFTDDPKTRDALLRMELVCPRVTITQNKCTFVPPSDL